MAIAIQQAKGPPHILAPGAWDGIGICIVIFTIWLLRYSYLASPFWFLRIKHWLGIRPSDHTPISHEPIYGPDGPPEPPITPPDMVHIRHDVEEALPVYEPSPLFSSDVLEALGRLGTPGTRPPSYRCKLSTDLLRVIQRDEARPRSGDSSGRVNSLRRLFSRSGSSG